MKTTRSNKGLYNSFPQNLKMVVLAIAVTCFVSYSQGQTLEFSQVKLVSSQETVPDGKVWKITAVLPDTRLTSTAGTSYSVSSTATRSVFLINGTTVYYASSDSRGSVRTGTNYNYAGFTASAAVMNALAVWLPATTTLEAGTGVFALSVIEFTVVP